MNRLDTNAKSKVYLRCIRHSFVVSQSYKCLSIIYCANSVASNVQVSTAESCCYHFLDSIGPGPFSVPVKPGQEEEDSGI